MKTTFTRFQRQVISVAKTN